MKTLNLSKEEWERIYKDIECVVIVFQSNINEKHDLMHDALLHVIKRLKTTYFEEGKLDVWVKQVTLNFCKDRVTDYYRKNTTYYEELIKEPIITYKYQLDDIKKKMIVELMEESIEELNHIDKQIIIGRLNEESYSAIAIKLKKNKKTIIKHCKKALIELRDIINKKYLERYGEDI